LFIFRRGGKQDINKIFNLFIILLIAIVPIALLLLEPDNGTAITYIVFLALMLFAAGINRKTILIVTILLAISLPLIYLFVMPDYAKTRIEVYINPETDPRGAGYNIIQSKLAIGSGQLLGMGWMKGTQTHLGFLYPKTTDFIFAVIGEELGFITSRSHCRLVCGPDYEMYIRCQNC